MKTTLSISIYSSTSELPENWNELAVHTVFLTKQYLQILEQSAPKNMICHYIGFFRNNQLVGICLSQFLDTNKLESFGERDKCLKKTVRNFIFKNFSSHVLIIGNNMLTGQNAFFFNASIAKDDAFDALKNAILALQKIFKTKKKKIHIITIKDFLENEKNLFLKNNFSDYFVFDVQPNMVFTIDKTWKTEQDYIDALSKKYRDQYKRARKKATEITKQKLDHHQIIKNQNTIYNLYHHVAKNAPFNTFFLTKNHFEIFKKQLQNNFLFYGYFIDNKLIGFNTLIKNGSSMDTYFLGYDDSIQKEKMLYLNMLYDMIAYSIKKEFHTIVFARTALEIKSSVGAKPIKMYGFIKHTNSFINKFMPKFFNYLEPKVVWQERNPFK